MWESRDVATMQPSETLLCLLSMTTPTRLDVILTGLVLTCVHFAHSLAIPIRSATTMYSNKKVNLRFIQFVCGGPLPLLKNTRKLQLIRNLMYFHHITYFVATQESGNSRNLVPAEHLKVEINADQVELLKPT
jgi:hypothetical protein